MSRVVIVRNVASWNVVTAQDATFILVQDFENAMARTRALQHAFWARSKGKDNRSSPGCTIVLQDAFLQR